MDELGKELHK